MLSQTMALPNVGTTSLEDWPAWLRSELEQSQYSGAVGTVLVSETDKVRVWHLHLPPGKRCGFHRHVLDYFWSAHNPGQARGYYSDGRVVDVDHYAGETKHFCFSPGEFFVHSIENIGSTDLLFTTVEFLKGSNVPLPVPEGVRLMAPGLG